MDEKYVLVIRCLRKENNPEDFAVVLDSPPDHQICPTLRVQTDSVCLKHNYGGDKLDDNPHHRSHKSKSMVIALSVYTDLEGLAERAIKEASSIFGKRGAERV